MRLPFRGWRKAEPKRLRPELPAKVAAPPEAAVSAVAEAEPWRSAQGGSATEAPDCAVAGAESRSPAEFADPTKEPESAATEPHRETDSSDAAEAPESNPNGDVNDWLRRAREARSVGRTAEAQSILETAARHFPEAPLVRHDLARLAEAGRDWAGAEQRWREYAALSVTELWVNSHLAHLLRLQGRLADAESLLADSVERFPTEALLFIDYARMAEMRRDWPTAGARWNVVAERFPDMWEGLTGQARALREQGQPDQARALLEDVAKRFSTVTGPIDELARVAEALRDWPVAEKWWRESVALDPAPWWATIGLVNVLREQGRRLDAEAVLIEQFERVAHEPWPLIEYARLAERSGDWSEAAKRWTIVQARFPQMWEGCNGLERSLRELGKLDEAEALLTGAVERFPGQTGPLERLAILAQQRRDWTDAERWWRAYLGLNAQIWQAHVWLASALREQQRFTEATDVLLEAMERFQQNSDALAEFTKQLGRLSGSVVPPVIDIE
jgi:tetratricopeptide (TPR) repeat protein